jgi:hypothetical protein
MDGRAPLEEYLRGDVGRWGDGLAGASREHRLPGQHCRYRLWLPGARRLGPNLGPNAVEGGINNRFSTLEGSKKRWKSMVGVTGF